MRSRIQFPAQDLASWASILRHQQALSDHPRDYDQAIATLDRLLLEETAAKPLPLLTLSLQSLGLLK